VSEAQNCPRVGRCEPVEIAGRVVGYTVRINIAEIEAVLIGRDEWDRPDHSLGVFRRRQHGRRAITEAVALWREARR
jgi:hypothetical protein